MLYLERHLTIALASACVLTACAWRSGDVQPEPANPMSFAGWTCERLHDESDRVQKRAAEVAYAVDERAGNNIIALGIGLAVFWPALIAMRPPGAEAEELARLKGRHEALLSSIAARNCAVPPQTLSAERAASLPVLLGERLVYEERKAPRGAMQELSLMVTALRRGELEFSVEASARHAGGAWMQDYSGNVTSAPAGLLQWPLLLRNELVLGQVVSGEMWSADAALRRARLRGQVVAVGPQSVAGRSFDVAVVELFGDASDGDAGSTRVEGVIVVDRGSGVLLRLDLRSAQAAFMLQRRLARVEPAPR